MQKGSLNNDIDGLKRSLDWDDIKRKGMESFSIFVDNLPPSMTNRWLMQLFGYEGRLSDVYIS